MEKLREVLNAGCRERLDRARRDGICADPFLSEARRQIARRRFERRLRETHRVVVGHNPFASEIGERQNGCLHEREKGLRQGRIGVGRDVHGNAEGLTGDAVQKITGNRLAGRKADRMDKAVHAAPNLGDFVGHGRDLLVAAHVHREDDLTAEFLSEARNAVAESVAHIGKGEIRAFAAASLGNAVGNRTIGNHARDQKLLAGEKTHVDLLRKE